MSDNSKSVMTSVLAAVITSVLVGGIGVFVAVNVQENQLERAQQDIDNLQTDVRSTRSKTTQVETRVTRIETSTGANERRHDERYESIDTRLGKLQEDMETLLRRMPRRPR